MNQASHGEKQNPCLEELQQNKDVELRICKQEIQRVSFLQTSELPEGDISSITLYQAQNLAGQEFPSVGACEIQTIVTYPHPCKDKIFWAAENSTASLAGRLHWNIKQLRRNCGKTLKEESDDFLAEGTVSFQL